MEALRDERLAPRAQAAGDERREADVDARDQEALEVSLPFEQRDLEQRLAVDLEQIECCEDLPRARFPHERIPIRIELELRLITPVGDEDPVDDRRRALGFGRDRVEQLPRAVHLAAVADEVRSTVSDARESPRSHPVRLEDVVRYLRAFAGEAGSLRRQIDAQNGLQLWSSIPPPLTARTGVLTCERTFDTAVGEHTNGRDECVRCSSCPSNTPRAGGVRLADAAARVFTSRAPPFGPPDGREGDGEHAGPRAARIAAI